MDSVTDDNFESLVARSHGLYVLMFSAAWCLPCQDMKPVFNVVADRYGSQASFGIADRDAIPRLRQEFNINSYPRVYVFRDGQLVAQREVSSKNYEHEIMIPLAPFVAAPVPRPDKS